MDKPEFGYGGEEYIADRCSFTLASAGMSYRHPCEVCGLGPCKHSIVPTPAPQEPPRHG